MRIIYTVSIGVRVASSSLKVPTANETGVDVDVGEGYGAEFFKVEIEDGSVDRI